MQTLQPHVAIKEKISISGDLQFEGDKLTVKFRWADSEAKIKMSEAVDLERQGQLWMTTCFEAFIQPEGKDEYFEINLSTSGAWNAYEFSSYRSPRPPKETEKLVLLGFHREENELEAQFSVLEHHHNWWCGLTAVIELKSGEKAYFATEHMADRPDFHMKETFKLRRVSV